LIYQRRQICKVGKPHTWKRVTRCVQGPVLSNKGFNYKTGKGGATYHFDIHTTKTVISGLTVGDCYRFRAYDMHKAFLGEHNGLLYAAEGHKHSWKVLNGKV
jgi:hypothetical protein